MIEVDEGSKLVKLMDLIIKKMEKGRCGSGIWSRGGPQLLRPKVADIVEWSCTSKVSYLQPGSRACFKGPGSFWVFNAQIYILPHSRDSFTLIFVIYRNNKNSPIRG